MTNLTVDSPLGPLTLEAVGGQVQIPDAPGWGVSIDAQWLERAERAESALS